MNPLTDRLQTILEMYAAGMTRQQIASASNRNIRTIERQKEQILEKLGADSIPQAVAMAVRRGIIS